jgi:hypothetical protein
MRAIFRYDSGSFPTSTPKELFLPGIEKDEYFTIQQISIEIQLTVLNVAAVGVDLFRAFFGRDASSVNVDSEGFIATVAILPVAMSWVGASNIILLNPVATLTKVFNVRQGSFFFLINAIAGLVGTNLRLTIDYDKVAFSDIQKAVLEYSAA